MKAGNSNPGQATRQKQASHAPRENHTHFPGQTKPEGGAADQSLGTWGRDQDTIHEAKAGRRAGLAILLRVGCSYI